MTTPQAEGLNLEQSTQPVPSSSSDEMALDLNINGTSHRDETSGDVATSNASDAAAAKLPSLSAPSKELSPNVDATNGEVNGAAVAPSASIITDTIETSLEPQPIEASSAASLPSNPTVEEPSQVSATDSDLPTLAPTLPSADDALEAAIEETATNSTVPPVVEAQQSDIRDSTPPTSNEPVTSLEQANISDKVDQSTADESLPSATATTNSVPTTQEGAAIDAPESATDLSLQGDSNSAPTETPLKKEAEQEPSASGVAAEQDTEMTDAPQPSASMKVAREREDDEETERSVKRTKTDDESHISVTTNGTSIPAKNGESSSANEPAEAAITPYLTKEIVKQVKNAARTADGKHFRAPVTELWPLLAEAYNAKVAEPSDFATIEKKLKAGTYPTLKEVKHDIRLLFENCVAFNGPDHEVTRAAQRASSALLGKLANIPQEPMAAPKSHKKSKASTPVAEHVSKASSGRRQSRGSALDGASAQTFALDPQSNTPLIRRDSTKNETGRPKRDIIPPKNKDLPYSVRPKSKKFAIELRWCHEALAEMKKPKYGPFAYAFMNPVDPVALGIPTYFSVIKHPMDISTVETKLENGSYTTSKDFEKDVGLIFSNCFKFNPPGNPVHELGKQFESLWKEQLAKKTRWISDHTPAVVSASPTPDSEAEESEEEPDVAAPPDNGGSAVFKRLVEEQSKLISLLSNANSSPGDRKLQQDMVDFLKAQVDNEKAKAVPAKKSKKAQASKAAPAPSKKKAQPPAKSSKKAGRKDRYLGTMEKEVISLGIGSLPEDVSETVLGLIQADRPDVGTEDDGTLELDIDLVAAPTLWKIYDLVQLHCPDIERTIKKTYENRDAPRAAAKPASKKKNKPMNKYEQDQKIRQLEGTLQNFERQTSGSQEPLPTVENNQNDSSGDEDSDSEEE